MKVEVLSPDEFTGDIIGDINSRRGMIDDLGERGNMKTIQAKVPLANMFQYVSDLRSMSKGRAQYTMTFDSYNFVPPDVSKEIEKKYGGRAPAAAGVDLAAQDDEGGIVGTLGLVLLCGLCAGSGIIFAVLKSSLLLGASSSKEPLLAPLATQ